MTTPKPRPTRYPELGYAKHAPNLWRIIDLTTPEDPAAVGPHYRTRAELLADLERYARVFGCLPETPARKEPADLPRTWPAYERAVRALESEGLDRSDAQGVVDAQLMAAGIDPNTLKPMQPKTEA